MTDRLITRDELIEFFRDRDPSEQDVEDREAWATEAADAFVERFFEGAMLLMPHPLPDPQIINLDELSETLDPEHLKLFTETRVRREGEPARVRTVKVLQSPIFTVPEEQRYDLLPPDAKTVHEAGGSLHNLIQVDRGGVQFTQPPEWAEKLAEETNSLIASGGGWTAPALADDCECEDREALVRPEGLVCGTCGKLIEARP